MPLPLDTVSLSPGDLGWVIVLSLSLYVFGGVLFATLKLIIDIVVLVVAQVSEFCLPILVFACVLALCAFAILFRATRRVVVALRRTIPRYAWACTRCGCYAQPTTTYCPLCGAPCALKGVPEREHA